VIINIATAKRWIQQMPISDEEKKHAEEKTKGMNSEELNEFLNGLRQKCGSKHYMNKKAKKLAVK